MDPFDTDTDDFDDDDQLPSYATIDEERNILRPGRQALGLTTSYVPWWKPSHAIREFYQNWKDAIKETSNLRNRNFEIDDKGFDSKNTYLVLAIHPDSKALLGWIRWEEKGILEFTNLNAQLRRKSLGLGATSKRANDDMAGTHGEGFKIACLVMTRRNFRVRFEATSYYWNFKLCGRFQDHLYCLFSECKSNKVMKEDPQSMLKSKMGIHPSLKADIRKDVCVKMGKLPRMKDGVAVSRSDFLKWIKVALDLDRPAKMIHTKHGDLILDETFKGRIYLKGLLMEGSSVNPYRFGYNFLSGEVNRDRQRLEDPGQEALILSSIWAEAIQLDESATLSHYVELLQSESQYGEVQLAEDNISLETAKKIWRYLRRRDQGTNKFYYYIEDSDRDLEDIERSLKQKPFSLQKRLWIPLRRHKLVRTPAEQKCLLLENAPPSVQYKSRYSDGLERALRSALALDVNTSDLNIEFRSGEATDLDLLLKAKSLLINDKWLSFRDSHENAHCSLSISASAAGQLIDQFSCTHIIVDLYDLVLLELCKSQESAKYQSILRRKLAEAINQMPCDVQVAPGTGNCQLDVRWIHPESIKASKLHGLDWKGWLILHKESTCSLRKLDLLAPASDEINQPGCDCSAKIVSLKDNEVTFTNLNPSELYFPMLSGIGAQAFFAYPPQSVRPQTSPLEDMVDPKSFLSNTSHSRSRNFTSGGIWPSPEPLKVSREIQDDDHASLYESTSADDTDDDDDNENDYEMNFCLDNSLDHTSPVASNAKRNTPNPLTASPPKTPNQTSIHEAEHKIAQLEEDLRTTKAEYDIRGDLIDEHLQAITGLEAQVADWEINDEFRDSELAEVKRELSEKAARLQELSTLAETLQSTKIRLQADLLDQENISSTAINILRDEVKSLTIQIQQLKSEFSLTQVHSAESVVNGKMSMQNPESEISKLEANNQGLRQCIVDLHSEIDQLRDDLENALHLAVNASTRARSQTVPYKRKRIKTENDSQIGLSNHTGFFSSQKTMAGPSGLIEID